MQLQTPHLTLVLISLLSLNCGSWAQSAFTIDSVKLTLLPGNSVESGTKVTLRCDVKVSHSFPQLSHTFTFMKYNTIIYSKNSSQAMVERSFTPARRSNSGSYQCRVTIHSKEKSSNTETLTVRGLQTPLLRVESNVVNEGEKVTATCSVPEETGPLQFSFYRNQQMFMILTSNENSTNTSVEFQESGESDLHCTYRHMEFPDSSNSSNIERVLIQPVTIIPSIKVQPGLEVVEGDRVRISCDVLGHSKNGYEVFLTDRETLLMSSPSSFTHSFEVNASSSGRYVCKVETGKTEKISTAELFVAELLSRPVLSMSPQQVFQGQMLTLSCRTLNINQERITKADVKFELYKDQHPLKEGHTFNFTASQSSNGNYTCRATAKNITKESKQLIINAKVPVSPPVIRAVGQVIVGKPFQLLCESELGTLPISYTLLRYQRPFYTLTVSGPQRSAVFNISYINHADEIHSFTCQAQGGAYSRFSQALNTPVIEPVSKPELSLGFPRGQTFTEGTDVSLYCSVQQGTVPVTFFWYRVGSSRPLFTSRSSVTRGEHVIRSITRDHRGKYYCGAYNDAGQTQNSEPVTVGVNLAGWKKAVIAVICILILVLIVAILVLFLKKARTPRKRKRAVELSVKPARPKSSDPMRMSLTLDIEDNTAVNNTPGVMGRNVWSDHVSDSESDDPGREEECEKLRYTEIQPQQPNNPEEALVVEECVIVNSELQDGTQEDPDHQTTDSVEYVQLNHCNQNPE
ncbi:platelet endothelial cell adhesion molecule isoform X2 [Astyanax mexicanus]|uniref:platelet endothelial cell adhesion molecule isoform X2 n=1 Tax=Astyanax mexicanus TaxID=7994 RepID=UPI0020CB2594|nr:platelet endothelial cell adhesion molecule isoform X2 [Astyanax mexicanus]